MTVQVLVEGWNTSKESEPDPVTTTEFLPRPSALKRSTQSKYTQSAFASVVPLKAGPGTGYNVQPSGQCWPVAVGPLSTLHLLRSKLASCPLPPSDVQTSPFVSKSTPRGT